MKYGSLFLSMGACCVFGVAALAGAGEPFSFEALLGPQSDAMLENAIPTAIDIAQKACKDSADVCVIRAEKVADLPKAVRRSIESSFPKQVTDEANLYFGMPLNDPQMGIGFINKVGMMAAGGGEVMGMTFGNDVYVECTREAPLTDAEALSLVGHELVHVAQYQALGFSKYKELYARETVVKGSYEENALEKEAFLFQDRFSKFDDRGFFAFYRSKERPELVVARDKRLVALDDLAGLDTRDVIITAAGESLARRATLVLGSNEEATGRVAPQLLDTHGGEPLYVFGGFGATVKVVANLRASKAGPYLVALGSYEGVEIGWRAARGFRTQRFPAGAKVEDHNGTAWVVTGTERWRWTGAAFARG